MTAPLASSMFAWLLTYLIHSSALLGLAWLVTRRRRLEPVAADLLWKVALVAGLVTGTIQSRLDLSTSRAVTLPAAASPAAPSLREPALGVQGFPDVLDRRFAPVPEDAQDGELQLGELVALRHARSRG